MLRLYDTAAGCPVEIHPRDRGKFTMYVCGPTVYDTPHLGHGRSTLVFDILRRYLEWSGIEVLHVSNITDVDDKIITRAANEGITTQQVASANEAAWWVAMDSLAVARPSLAPHATEFVGPMVALVESLLAIGLAYRTPDGVYLEVSAIPDYGLLARQRIDSLRAGARVAADESKRSPLDFALWKLAKPGEPSWTSPFGEGRPGWHTECVAMALDLCGDDFDLHGGGADLAFPHHENERAQAEALGRPFARHWMHHGWVVDTSGEKMSKSTGNFTTLADLLERSDPRAYRLAVARTHYRSPMVVTPETLGDAERALGRLDALVRRASGVFLKISPAVLDRGALSRFAGAMEDDLDTPGAVAGVFEVARRANAALDAGATAEGAQLASTVVEMASALGLRLGASEDEAGEQVAELVRRRDEARAARDWAAADALREELAALGWAPEDTPSGTRVRRLGP